MQPLIPFALALSIGFGHAFKADHLVAVSSIVTRRRSVWLALKDGAFWGLGHTSTILVVGGIFLLVQVTLNEDSFRYVEAGVGVMLMLLGFGRLYTLVSQPKATVSHPADHVHADATGQHEHKLAYGVGLLHGLAGSGALILSVLAQSKGAGAGMLYLVLFGMGSMGGMVVAVGAFIVPFSARLTGHPTFRTALVLLSSVLCIELSVKIICETMLA